MLTTLDGKDRNTYYELIKRFPLRPIHSEKENNLAAEVCDGLTTHIGKLSRAEQDYLEVLTDLIVKYESRWDNEFTEMTPRELIQYLIEQNNLAQNDLIPEFGSASRVSEFLNGKRNLSLDQARKLSKRFKLQLSALLRE